MFPQFDFISLNETYLSQSFRRTEKIYHIVISKLFVFEKQNDFWGD